MLETTTAARCSWELPLHVGWLCEPGVLYPVPPSNESVLAHLVAMMAMLRCLFQWDWPRGGCRQHPGRLASCRGPSGAGLKCNNTVALGGRAHPLSPRAHPSMGSCSPLGQGMGGRMSHCLPTSVGNFPSPPQGHAEW